MLGNTVSVCYDFFLIIDVLIFQYVGYRVNQVYDIDNKTYLLKLQKPGTNILN